MGELKWKHTKCVGAGIHWGGPDAVRTKVPGGWLIFAGSPVGSGMTFYPDPNHEWDGNSLPD